MIDSNNTNNQKMSIENGNVELTYTDCANNKSSDCSNISAELKPGDSVSKTFSVKNTGTLDTNFKIVFSKSISTFINDELTYTLYNNDDNTELSNGNVPYGDKTNSYIYTDIIKSGETKNYKMTITFKNIKLGNNESNKDGNFNVKVGIQSTKPEVWNFDYTGGLQTFVVPKKGKYSIELWGASGATKSGGGNAGYTAGILNLNVGDKFYIYVGEAGKIYPYHQKFTDITIYNCLHVDVLYTDAGGVSLGGGSTDIRTLNGAWDSFDSLKSRIMVAGGSGGQVEALKIDSSYGGGLHGGAGVRGQKDTHTTVDHLGYGGTQTNGGRAANLAFYGSFGSTNIWPNNNGTGGGGYYGGGSGNGFGTDAGGGSSFISGHNGCVAITEDSTEDNIKQRTDSVGKTCTDGTTDITCSYHYSDYRFTDTVMIDGEGYNWTTEKGEYVGQPQPDGSITKGHSGNGYARITYLGNN